MTTDQPANWDATRPSGYMDAAAVPDPDAGDDTLRERLAEALHQFDCEHVPAGHRCESGPRIIDDGRADALLPLIRDHVATEVEIKSVVHECCEARQTAEVELERLRTMTGMADAAGARTLDERNEALSAIEQVRALVADVYAFNQLPEGHIHGVRDHIGSAVCLAMKITSALDEPEADRD